MTRIDKPIPTETLDSFLDSKNPILPTATSFFQDQQEPQEPQQEEPQQEEEEESMVNYKFQFDLLNYIQIRL